MGELTGKRIIVTGGASGMGAALVRDYVAQGAAVVACDINDPIGQEIAAEAARKGPGRASYLHCDVSDEASVNQATAEAVAWLGGLDGLVHAAGISPGCPAEDITLDKWEKVMAVNARGTFLTNKAVFPHLKDKGGRIINFASGAGISGQKGKAHYSATKGAVVGWSRVIAKEWGQYGITVNMIAPAIDSPMYQETRRRMTPEQLAEHERRLAVDMPIGGKLGDVGRDFVPVLRFLVGDGSRFMTGQVVAIDGGLLMVR